MAIVPCRRILTILTEENPQLNEIAFILSRLNVPAKTLKLSAYCESANKWKGEYRVVTDLPDITVSVYLVKGHGSFVDYVVYDHAEPCDASSVPILLVESTKTNDGESRNTAIYQRFTKFAVARRRFPNTPLIMFFNAEHTPKTATSVFGRRLLSTYGVEVCDVKGHNLLSDAPPFANSRELVEAKNAIPEKKGNISVKIAEPVPHRYSISAKLAKGANDSVSNDPNKGLVTGIASVIHSFDPEATFVVTQHGVNLTKLATNVSKKTAAAGEKEGADKFWYANGSYDLRLEGSDVSSLGYSKKGPYWTRDIRSEKAATVLFQNIVEATGLRVIYHNHSSSARSFFEDLAGVPHAVPKTVTIPDLVFVNTATKRFFICEGKVKKDIGLGVKQLDAQTAFMEFAKRHYPDFGMERGLCLFIPSLDELDTLQTKSSYPIWFALDNEGTFINRLS